MSISAEFLVASPNELRACFPDWLEVSDVPVVEEYANPRTGRSEPRKRWVSVDRDTKKKASRAAKGPSLQSCEFGGIVPEYLLELISLVLEIPAESAREQLDKPALLDPHVPLDSRGMYCLSKDFTWKLAAVGKGEEDVVAAGWSERCPDMVSCPSVAGSSNNCGRAECLAGIFSD